MKEKNFSVGSCPNKNSIPKAYISVAKNRQKVYHSMDEPSKEQGTVYLPNQVEFEIELFNPTEEKFLAVLTINGKQDQKGFILKPGQRFFLDRYLTEKRKFLFDVYEVSSSDEEVKKAIKNNGKIRIDFFKEKIKEERCIHVDTTIDYLYNPSTLRNTTTGDPIPQPTYIISQPTRDANGNTLYRSTTTANWFFLNTHTNSITPPRTLSNEKMETGRVDKGSKSDQEFNESTFTSYSFPTITFEYTLLPVSRKPLTSKEINEEKSYCFNCGKKIKKEYKFCPVCGVKIE
jgi:hypothetical protein